MSIRSSTPFRLDYYIFHEIQMHWAVSRNFIRGNGGGTNKVWETQRKFIYMHFVTIVQFRRKFWGWGSYRVASPAGYGAASIFALLGSSIELRFQFLLKWRPEVLSYLDLELWRHNLLGNVEENSKCAYIVFLICFQNRLRSWKYFSFSRIYEYTQKREMQNRFG